MLKALSYRHLYRISIGFLLIGMASLLACNKPKRTSAQLVEFTPEGESMVRTDLSQILERGYLVLLTENTSTSYYLYKGQPLGYDYELIRSFCEYLGVELKVTVMKDLNRMYEMLNEGEGDIIASNLSITQERKQRVAFTQPLMQTHQVLVQNKKNEPVRNVIGLKGKKVFVHPHSSFHERLLNLEREIGGEIDIRPVNGAIDSEKLIRLVAQGDLELTVADHNLASLNETYYPEIDIRTKISFDQDVAWAVRKSSKALKAALNDWISSASVKHLEAYVERKYYKHAKDQQKRVLSPFSSIRGGRISKYDDKIKEESQKIGWDWKLIAALIYQESRFDPEAKSWVGASGLMQLMPNTAKQFGVDSVHTEYENIEGGVRYLEYLEGFWEERILDDEERKKFVLGSYNVGPGHVLDAQKLATHLGKDPLVWAGHVDECLLLKSDPAYYNLDVVKYGYCRGAEPYAYVQNIMEHYQHYSEID